MTDFVWEFYQHGRILKASADASQALSKIYLSKADISDIELKLERLALLNQAIWSLVKQQTSLCEADLMEEVKRLDGLDGRVDGKLAETKTCSQCGIVLTASANICYGCGAPSPVSSPFHSIK